MRNPAIIALFLSIVVLISACGDAEEIAAAKEIPLDELIELHPDSAELFVKRGRIYFEDLNFPLAVSDAATAFRLDSTNAEVERLYADVLNNNPERTVADIYVAQRHYKKLLGKDTKNTNLLVSLASTYAQQQDFERAFTYINDALRIDPRYRDAYTLKGTIYRLLGNTELMKSSYETAIQQDPEYFAGYFELGRIYKMEENKVCIQYFSTASSLKPENPLVMYELAHAQQHFGQVEEAKNIYRTMLKDTNDYYSSQAYFQLGHIKQFLIGDLDSAMYFYGRAIYVEPRYVEAHHNLGVCHDLKGDKTQALFSFGRALKYNSEFALSRDYADSIRFL